MKKGLICILMLLILVSCAHVDQAKEKQPAEAKAAAKPVDISSPVSFQVEKTKQPESVRAQDSFSFSLRDADVKDILRAIAKQTNYNVVTEPDVKGITTVDLKNVTLEKALEYILEPLNFAYKIEGRTVYVSKPKVETRIFHLNYVSLKKLGTSTVYASPGAAGGVATGTTTAPTTAASSKVSVISETESDLWKNLEDNLKTLVSKEGKFVINKPSFMVMVTDFPVYLKNISMFIEGMEKVLHRQIMIEAKIIEVQLSDGFREGVNWRLLQSSFGGMDFRGQQVFLNPLATIPATSTTIASATPYFRFFVGSKQIDTDNSFIDILKTQGKVDIISSPKIATMNNQRAIIKVTRQDVYFDEQQTALSGGGSTATYTPRFIDVGLTLDVTPQIDHEGNIILSIHPMLTEKVSTVLSKSGTEVPILDIREADTIVRIKDGETVVIGGLIKNSTRTDTTGVPGLMSVPFFGWLFRYNQDTTTKTELVVLLTPTIAYIGDTQR